MFTEQDVAELRTKMSTERARLIDAVQRLSPDEASHGRPEVDGEEGWSSLQQLAHLWEMELSYDSWIVACLEGDRPDLSILPMARPPVAVEQANGTTAAELLASLAAERAKTEALIDGLALGQFARTGLHPVFGELNVMQWLRSFYRHDRMHRMQIEGREPDYQPRAAGAGLSQRRVRERLGPEGLMRIGTMREWLDAAADAAGSPQPGLAEPR